MGVPKAANNLEIALALSNAPGIIRLIPLQPLQVRLKRLDMDRQSREKRIAAAVKQWNAGRSRPTRLELMRDLDLLLEAVKNSRTHDLGKSARNG